MLDLKGKNIFITGASSGIGSRSAILCSELGASVIISGRNKDRLQKIFNSLSGDRHLQFVQDVTSYNQLEPIISESVTKLGKIDGFIHSAGIEMTYPLRNMSAEKYHELFAVNTISALELGRILSKKKYYNPLGASFVFISSVMGNLGAVGKVGYCSSKSALVSGSKAMALELAQKSIRVNCVSPGIVETEMVKKMIIELPEESVDEIQSKHPLGFGKPDDIANICAFLLSDLSKWITGSDIVIDGGYSCQ
jgi:NAD(P)-dependent dehydrogenase (short-subunit alcohol dehydrogenase family)